VALATVLVILIAPAGAVPSLSLNSVATYQYSALTTTFDSCSSTNLTIALFQCGSSTIPITSATVLIADDGLCSSDADPDCKFSPPEAIVNVGGRIEWRNNGTLVHDVTFDDGTFASTLYSHGSVASRVFNSQGDFSYHCSIHPWMTGTITVVPLTLVQPRSLVFSSEGTIGWTVVGLDDDALLSVKQDLVTFNATSTPPTKYSSQFSIQEETIELSTGLVSGPAAISFPSPFPYPFPYPYISSLVSSPGYGYTGPGPFYPPFFPYYSPFEVHTAWWVNGPLRLGSNVEILTGYASVRGETSVAVGTVEWSAWLVESQYIQKFSQAEPTAQFPGSFPGYPQYYTANSTYASSMEFAYGQASDMLLSASGDTFSHFESVTVFPPGYYVYAPYPYPYSNPIQLLSEETLTRIRTTSTVVTLSLSSTSLDLSQKTIPPPESTNGPGTTEGNNPPASPVQAGLSPVVYGVAGVAAALMVSGGLWLATRNRRRHPKSAEKTGQTQTAA